MAKFSFTVNTDNAADIAALIAAMNSSPAYAPQIGRDSVTSALGGGVPQMTISPDMIAGANIGNANISGLVVGSEDEDNTPVNTAAPQVDSAGLPWDERIHAKSKNTKADGTWKRGRGVTDEQAATVEAELRARMAGPVPTMQGGQPAPFVPPVAPTVPVSNVPQFQPPVQQAAAPVATMPAQPQQQPPFTAPTPQQPAQTPQPQQQPQALDFNTLMSGLQRAMSANRIDVAGLAQTTLEINQSWNSQLSTITDLAQPQFAHMIPWVKDLLVNKGVWVD